MTVPVVWWSSNPESVEAGYWDQGWLEAIFDGSLWRTIAGPTFGRYSRETLPQEAEGAVVVVPGRWHVELAKEIEAELARLAWVLLIITGDEEDLFPRIEHPNMKLWTQTPRPSTDKEPRKKVGDFWPPDAPKLLAQMERGKDLDFFFAGQINNTPRTTLVEVCDRLLRRGSKGSFLATEVFGSGLPYEDYLSQMARARVVPCPAGPFTPDTFRLYEALEAGCIPVIEARAPNVEEDGYWPMVLGDHPLPVVESWVEFPRLLEVLLTSWTLRANRISAWWQGYKRSLAYDFHADLREAAGRDALVEPTLTDKVTVLIPTSPAPVHPDTSVIEETVASVLERLEGAEVFVMIDGVRPELENRRADYTEYVNRLLWLCEHRWPDVLPILHTEHLHQAEMTRRALELVRTPTVLFVEHDTPLVGDIPFADLVGVVKSGQAHVVRLNHEASILPDHRHMALDEQAQDVGGVPLVRTVQYSQRPHVASTEFYRAMIRDNFTPDDRTMLEDVMHGVVHTAWREHGLAGWERFRLFMYHPEGNIKRSGHSDARGSDEKYGNYVKVDA